MISIIIPVYNAEKYLLETLESIVCQTYSDWKCILIDDGSTDRSHDIINDYCAKYDRFLGVTKENEGSADLARRYGMQFVDTDFAVNIDADDVVEQDFIKKLVDRQVETGADCVLGRLVGCVDGVSREDWYVPIVGFDFGQIVSGRDAFKLTVGSWQIPGCVGNLFKSSLYKLVNYSSYINADEFTARQILYHADSVAFTDARYYYRDNDGTSVKFSSKIFSRAKVDEEIENFIYEHYDTEVWMKEKIAYQRMFNMIYLAGDFHAHKRDFSYEVRASIKKSLKESYSSLRKEMIRRVLPCHSIFLGPFWLWFYACSSVYVTIKRHRGTEYCYK